MQKVERHFATLTQKVHPSNYKNACNLVNYLVLRSLDIRELQDHLHVAGLSSLTSSESHIRGQVLSILQRLGKEVNVPNTVFDYKSSKESCQRKASALLG